MITIKSIMKNIILLFVCSLWWIHNSTAQITTGGIVMDKETSESLFGVTVQLKGTTEGTSTSFDGQYELSLPAGEHTLVFSYIGMKTKEVTLTLFEDKKNIASIVYLESSTLVGETVVVTSGKYAKKLEESTVSVDVIDRAMIENTNATSLDQVVQKTSGVQIIDNQVNIRSGAGYAYGVGSRVAFLVDGQPLLSAELSDVKWNFMPLENAEQIEIIKGSSSVLYGSGALNGVINIRTAYPKGKDPYTAFSLYSGIYDQPRIDSMRWFDPKKTPTAQPLFTGLFFAHRARLHKNFDLVLGGNLHLENGFLKDVDERRARFNFNTRYRHPGTEGRISYGINGTLMYHRQGNFFLAKNMREGAYTNVAPIYGDRYGSITLDPYFTIYDQADNKHDIKGRWFNIAKHQPGPDSDAHVFSLEYQFQRTFPKKWVLTAGILGQYFNVNSILFTNATNTSERALKSGQSIAAYAQIEKKFWDKLSVVLGGRWEGYLIGDQFFASPPVLRAGLNLAISPNDHLRASFGQGFRVPSFGEIYINEPIPLDGGFQLGIFPNPNLKPESGWSTELAYRRTFRFGKFHFYTDVALFWMEYSNMIEAELDAYPQGFGFRFNNVSQARIAGFEISTQSEGKIGAIPLKIWGGYTFSFPGDLTADTSLRRADTYIATMANTFANGITRGSSNSTLFSLLKYRSLHTFRLDIQAEYKGFTLAAAANYTSMIQNVDAIFDFGLVTPGVAAYREIHNNGAWIFDIRLGYKINPKQRINLVVQNLLNEEYTVRPARMGAPRSFSVKYSHVF